MGKILSICIMVLFWANAFAYDPDIPAKNVNDYGGVMSAVTAAKSSGGNLLFTDIQTIPSGVSITFGPSIETCFVRGSGVSISQGATAYFTGPIVAGNYQIVHGQGVSYFEVSPMEQFFQNRWIGGTSGIGLGRTAGPYTLDISGTMRVQKISDAQYSTQSSTAGAPYIVNLVASKTLSGDSVFGGAISNHRAASEVTGTVVSGTTVGMNFSMDVAGTTMMVIVFDASDSVLGYTNFSTANSAFVLQGIAGSAYGSIRTVASNVWLLSGASLTTRNK